MLDREQVHKVAQLARLELTPEEEAQFATQLTAILDYFQQLNDINIPEDIQPTLRAVDIRNIVRPDQLQPSVDREDLLNCAPDRAGDFFRVPKIVND